uniref:Uncharacterized protein n=1 Tax=Rhizophora mucronata TaxID=61149 RepID=A0A2P2IIK6_RHIMU
MESNIVAGLNLSGKPLGVWSTATGFPLAKFKTNDIYLRLNFIFSFLTNIM